MANTAETLSLRLALDGLATVEAGFKRLEHATESVKEFALEAAAAYLGFKGVESVVEATKHVIELGSQLNNLKNRVGATIPELLSMRKLLSENGGSADEVAMLMQRMETNIAKAAETGGALEKAFNDIGLSATKLSGMPTGKAFHEIADGIARLPNEFKKSEVSMAVFGKTGNDVRMAFANLKTVEDAYAADSAFKTVMERSAEAFHETEVAVTRFAMNGTKVMAGFLDQLVPMFKESFEELGNIDFTEVGQKIGGFFAVIIQSARDGKFPEMVGLLIEAGFEVGVIAAKVIWKGLTDFMESSLFATLFVSALNAVMTFGVKAAELILSAAEIPITYIGTATEWMIDQLREKFQRFIGWLKDSFASVVNFLSDKLESVLNTWNKLVSKLGLGGSGPATKISFPKVSGASDEVAPAVSWATAYANESKTASEAHGDIQKYLDSHLKASREILKIAGGITSEDHAQYSALTRLNALVEAQLEKRKSMAVIEEQKANPQITGFSALKAIEEQELALRSHLVEIQSAIQKVEGSDTMTKVEQYKAKLKLLTEEKDTTQKIVDLMKQRVVLLDKIDPARGDNARKQLIGEQGKLPGISGKIDKLGPNPESWGEQFQFQIQKIQNAWGSWQIQAGEAFGKTFSVAVSSISAGIEGLIMGTKTWGQALMNIGNTIFTTLISSIVQMGVQWVLTHVIMSTVATAFNTLMVALGWASTSQQIAQETVKAPLLATNATTASVGSYGTAALVGVAALVAALGVGIAAASGAFAEGGYTGAGGKYDVAGVVHAGEFVMPAHAVSRIGLPALEAQRQGGSASSSGRGAGSHNIHVGVFDDRSNMRDWVNSGDGSKVLLDMIGKNKHKFIT